MQWDPLIQNPKLTPYANCNPSLIIVDNFDNIVGYNMSRLITHTNILIDDFDFAKSFPRNTFTHILTHFHFDHYEGLSPLWDYGPIYCTVQTSIYLHNKYPKIQNIHPHPYNTPFTLPTPLPTSITFFDACHIPGSCMVLITGYMGTILFTGDFRFHPTMLTNNPQLFPPHKQLPLDTAKAISIHIDEMIFDNTYCHPIFTFQTEQHILQKIINIIEANAHRNHVLIAIGTLGKHMILRRLSQHFQTSIVVNAEQMHKIKLSDECTDFFTTDPSQGFIRMISKRKRKQIVEEMKRNNQNFICIDTDFLMLNHQSPDQINYIVPYSLHSNYREMATLIRLIEPCILRKIVIPFANLRQVRLRMKVDHRLKFAKYLQYLQKKVQQSAAGYAALVRQYTDITKLSKEFLKWMAPAAHKALLNSFGLGEGMQNHDLRKRKPILLPEEEWKGHHKKKQSLKSIADQLNAVDRNLCMDASVSQSKLARLRKQYTQIFQKGQSKETNEETNTQ